MMGNDYDQISLLDMRKQNYKIHNKIRLIELFGGIGSQAMALKTLGADFEHYRLVEYDKYPVASYNAIHGTNFTPMDITKINGADLGIVDTDKFTYLLTYLLVPVYRLVSCRKNARYGRRKRNKFIPVMGSQAVTR